MHLRFSKYIEALLQGLASKPLTIADILAETSERGFTLVIGLLVLPFLLPMPPGLTGVLGTGSLLLSAQMALGRRSPWLPKKIANFQFPQRFILLLLNNLKRVTRILEKLAKPRWQRIAQSSKVLQINGICLTLLTVLLMLPIPLTNPIPTIGMLLIVVATLEADGLLLCVSYGFTAAIALFFALIIYALWQAPNLLPNWS